MSLLFFISFLLYTVLCKAMKHRKLPLTWPFQNAFLSFFQMFLNFEKLKKIVVILLLKEPRVPWQFCSASTVYCGFAVFAQKASFWSNYVLPDEKKFQVFANLLKLKIFVGTLELRFSKDNFKAPKLRKTYSKDKATPENRFLILENPWKMIEMLKTEPKLEDCPRSRPAIVFRAVRVITEDRPQCGGGRWTGR